MADIVNFSLGWENDERAMIGQTLHHYRILDKLGEGGMGEVYLAEDSKLGRKVAFKVLPTVKAADETQREQFEREARLVASLNHPNIVTVHSVEKAAGVHFLTMELVEGETLGQRVPDGGLALDQFFDLALPLADAVGSAHDHGIIHRDLKPGNVMVTREGRVKVLDFGLATLRTSADQDLASQEREAISETVTHVDAGSEVKISGTVPYMSPEQLQGQEVGYRSDLFSLGVLFYEMLSGTRPFKDTSSVNLMVAIVRDPPPPLRSKNAAVPEAVARIIHRCLEKDPNHRYATTRELFDELKQVRLDWESGTWSSASVPKPQSSPLFEDEGVASKGRSHFLPLLIAAVTALAVFGVFSIMWPTVKPTEKTTDSVDVAPSAEKKRIVILPFENLGPSQEEYFAAGVTEEITSRLAMVSGLGVISRNSAVQYADTEKTTREIGWELDVEFILEGTVRWDRTSGGRSRVRVTPQLIRVVDDTHLWSQRYDRVLEDIFEVQSEIAEQVTAQLDVALFPREREALQERPTDNLEAYENYLRGIDYARRLTYSPANGQQALADLGRAVDLAPEFAIAHGQIAQVHGMLYHFGHDRTEARAALAKRAADRSIELAPESPDSHLAMGYYHYWVLRDYSAALKEFDLAEKGRPGDAALLEARAYIERRQGHWDEALIHLEQAVDLNPRDDRAARELGNTFLFAGRDEEALRYFDRAIDFAPDPLAAYQSKARALMKMGDLAASREALGAMPRKEDPLSTWFWFWQDVYEQRYREALERLASAPGDSIQWTVVYAPHSLLRAFAHDFLRQPELARQAYRAARLVLEQALAQTPDDVRLHNAMGHVYAGLGRDDEAVREAERAVELLPISRDAIFGVYRRIELALVLTRVDRLDQAMDELELILSMPSQLSVPLLKMDPRWNPLRGHPRFVALM